MKTPAKKKPVRLKLSEHANVLVIRERGGKPVRLPITGDDNRKLSQYEAAKLRGLLDEYMEENREELKDAKPRELRELGQAWQIAHELARAAYGEPTAPDAGSGKKDDADLIAEVARKSMEMGRKMEESRQKREPIEAEAEDVE